MRIALISTLARPVPPEGEGSVELLVSQLAERLVQKGHEVTLYALANSTTSARLRSPVQTSYVVDAAKWDWQLYESFQVREAFAAAHEFDVIHCHSYHFGLQYCDAANVPSLHSMHVDPGPDIKFLAERTRNRHLVFASQFHAREFTGMNDIHVIPHGVNLDPFYITQPDARQNYLAYLGRFHADKGVLQAIEIAHRTGKRIRLAGPANDYYRQIIQPYVDGKLVDYVGELDSHAKVEFLADAQALLYPVERGEPFGLVLVEAMASGLPVIALNRGAVPEIIENAVSGFVCDSSADMIAAVGKVDTLDREHIRALAHQRYSADQMASNFVSLYEHAVAQHSSVCAAGKPQLPI